MALTRARLFGLTIESDFALPGLLSAADDAEADVRIIEVKAIEEPDLIVDAIASFAVRDGKEIRVAPAPGAAERNVRLYLLGSAMGLLLHQRGLFPLHANAIALDGRAVAVAGPSGAGKSTLAAWFHARGHALIGDDVCVIRQASGRALAFPGVPRLRLWGEAMVALDWQEQGLERAWAGDHMYDKWEASLGAEAIAGEGVPLSAIYVLEDADDMRILPLVGSAAAEALFAHTYRGQYVVGVGRATTHWQAVTQLLHQVPIYRLCRPRDLTRLDALGQALLNHARSP